MHITNLDSCEVSSLRRCGRAFTGDQHLTEESLLQLLLRLADSAPANSRVDLYREYLAALYWSSWNRPSDDTAVFATPAAQAHWLTAVEKFSCCEAAEVLSISEAELERLLYAYQVDTAGDLAKRILIVEDEFFIAHELKSIIRRMGHEVVGTAATKEAALTQCRLRKPDLILSDVLLRDGSSGVEVLSELSSNCEIPAVFITAYPEFLRDAFPKQALFVIDKPYEPAAVTAMVRQALFFAESRRSRRDVATVH